MPNFNVECLYCGNKWPDTFYSEENVKYTKCQKCKSGHKYLKVRPIAAKVDYYPETNKEVSKKGHSYDDDDGNYGGID